LKKKRKLKEFIPFGDRETKLEWFKFCPNCGKPMKPIVMFLHYFSPKGDKIPYKDFVHKCDYCALGYKRAVLMTDDEYDYLCESKTYVFVDALDMAGYKRFKEKVKRKYGSHVKSKKAIL